LLAAASARRARTRPWRGSESYSELPLQKFFVVGGLLIVAGAAFGFLAVIERGWVMFWLGLTAMLGSFAYAHGPALRDKALAEVISFFLFGPFPVAAAYLAVTGVTPSAFTIQSSIPLGFLAAAASLAAGIRDVKGDRQAGSVTFATLFGRPRVDYIFLGLISASFVWLLVLVLRGSLAPICLLPWATLPQAIGIYATLRHASGEGNESVHKIVGRSARLYTYFAALLALSVAVSHLIWQRAV
jgi:1,4-dihydroxy-2-naphthoate octaprenyltransferase